MPRGYGISIVLAGRGVLVNQVGDGRFSFPIRLNCRLGCSQYELIGRCWETIRLGRFSPDMPLGSQFFVQVFGRRKPDHR